MQKTRHIPLSRKYRPTNLVELKGQDVLVKTLSNALKSNKISQSYLLHGIRGIGKTTTARIIAKTVNCTNIDFSLSVPISCEKCSNCISFKDSSHPDVLEIDAASRTGVDDVRVIIENSEYKPMMGNYKIFIIDEVHMLSKSAFNALLKLLEEPPSHCIFIFATTEVHKIPLTIISRCQRFDLARFSNDAIVNLLNEICIEEQISISKEAIEIIASKSDGSARDSLSLLDQALLVALEEDSSEIGKDYVLKMLSSVDHRLIINLLKSVIEKDAKKSLELLAEFYCTNSDFNVFVLELLSLISYIAKKLAITNYKSKEFYSYEKEITEIKDQLDMTFIQVAWRLTYNTIADLKISINQLQNMEMLILKLIYVLSMGNSSPFPVSQKPEDLNISSMEVAPNLSKDLVGSVAPSIAGANQQVQKLDVGIMEAQKKTKKLGGPYSFEFFLKQLSSEKEMQLFYDLFNNAELRSETSSEYILVLKKPDAKFENAIKSHLLSWSSGMVQVKFAYDNEIMSYKEKIKRDVLSQPIFKKISKNFSDLEIVDILVE